MRLRQISITAFAAISGTASLLSTSLPADVSDNPSSATSDIKRVQPSPHVSEALGVSRSADSSAGSRVGSSEAGSHISRARWLGWLASTPPALLPSLVSYSKADASGYDSIEASPPSSQPPATGPWAAATGAEGGYGGLYGDDGGDTITGVFHRLDPDPDPERARLVLVQVVFRHGARTPLSNRREMWGGQPWDVCGEAYQAAAVRLFSTAGVESPVSKHDMRQRSVVLEGGCRKGELTLLGQQQARDLGRWLRSRYVERFGFLPQRHMEGVVESRTTNFSRTVATLRGVLTGLYPDLPPGAAPTASTALTASTTAAVTAGRESNPAESASPAPDRQQPPPPRVTTSGDLDEILYADTRACPHLGSFHAMAREAGRAAIRADPDYGWARGEVLRLMGLDPATFDSEPWIFTDVHDNLTSLEAHGKKLPPGFEGQPRLRAAINRLATKEFAAEVAPSIRDSHGSTVLRLSMGRLLHTLVGNMRRSSEGAGAGAGAAEPQRRGAAGAPPAAAAAGGDDDGGGGCGDTAALGAGAPQMYLYSGHDSTIMPLLSALGLEVAQWPPYLSNLVFELWQLPDRRAAGGGGSSGGGGGGGGGGPRYAVRVLYNQEETSLPHCPPGFQPSLQTFEREVVGPFLLSAQNHAELCRVKVEHDESMPQPKASRAKAAPASASGTSAA